MRLSELTWPACLVLLTATSLAAPPDAPGPSLENPATARSPEESRRSIRVPEGFVVELAAQEPLVRDPIAFDWDADGRLWVVEMGDYPLGLDGKGKPGGLVRILEDTDADGRYDRATTFLAGLGFPTGVTPWRRGAIIACAPEIFYAEDRDGDGKADRREVLFTGFGEGNQQHRVNGFDWGLDGWVYGANGESGGNIRSVRTGRTVNIQGRDFRFRPDTGEFEAESGQTQYGRHRDDWGHWFGTNNPTWAWQYVLTDADLRRNPYFAAPNPRSFLEPDTRLFPASRTLPRFNDPGAANRVTSANSPTPYRDDLFGPDFGTSLFVSEPVHNLVHRIVLQADGPVLKGRRAEGEATREFLASTDHWFRPTTLKTGPDGALYVADMYRAVIEHPQWIPDDVEAKLDLRAGSEEGRIYRVSPQSAKRRPIPKLSGLSTTELVAAIESPSGWQRDTAQRLLVDRRDAAAESPLRQLATRSQRPKTRVQAVWTLAVLGALDDATVKAALADPHPQVRRAALQAGKHSLAQGGSLADAMLPLAGDPDAEVRLQAALTLGDSPDPRCGPALARVLRADPDSPWTRAAVLSAAPRHVGSLLAALLGDGVAPPNAVVEPLFTLAARQEGGHALAGLIRRIGTPEGQGGRYAAWQFSALAGMLDAQARGGIPRDARESLAQLGAMWSAVRATVGDAGAGDEVREQAVRLLGRAPTRDDADRGRLLGLLDPRVPARIQLAAATTLGNADAKAAEPLIAGWKRYTPTVRETVLDVLLSRQASTAALLSSLEDKCTPLSDVGPAHRRRLLAQRDQELRARAEALFSQPSGARADVVAAYRPAQRTDGSAAAGAVVFRRVCASCHRIGSDGSEVGPDLAALNDKTPESLLIAVLDPNRAFEAKYALFNVALKDGRVLSGMIAGETSVSVTLRRQEGKEDVILRTDIDELAATGQSLMPEGLEKDLKPQDMADLIAYLVSSKPPRAGVHP